MKHRKRKQKQKQRAQAQESEREPPPPAKIDPRFIAARRLLDLARRKVTPEDVRSYVPSDPGYYGYVSAFEAILRDGEAAITRDFDVVETVNLTRWGTAERDDLAFRWFRVLTCAVDILLDDPDAPHYRLVTLLVDVLALAEARDRDAPMELLPAICREIGASEWNTAARIVFCRLAELLLASAVPTSAAAIEALCAEVETTGERLHYVSSDRFIWGCTFFDQLHPDWVHLVATRFPVEPPAAAALRARLLHDGARWAKKPRTLER
jgi:hypothetical protein